MNETLAFTLIVLLAGVFAVIIGVITLRFLNVLTQIKRSDSFDRQEMMRELDQSHVAAFDNAMTALERVSERISTTHTEMFNRTMDAVHGPQHQPDDGQPYKVDDPRLDLRPPWAPNDDEDDSYIYADPTDTLMPEPTVVDVTEPNRDNGHAISVRPGEGLIPQ